MDNQHSTAGTHRGLVRTMIAAVSANSTRAGQGAIAGLIPRVMAVAAMLLLLTGIAGAKMNTSWLLPGGDTVVNVPKLDGEQYKFCALTFDDGPDAKYTGQVMSILDNAGIKATFFLVGNRIADYPMTTEALAASNHEIGNHSQTHPDMSGLSNDSQRRQFAGVNDQLAKYGVHPCWFRPPYGKYNQVTLGIARELGMETANWTIDPRDWSQPGVNTIVSRVLRSTTPGSVVLLHSTNAQTAAALPQIIDGLRARGYFFVTMSEWRALVSGEVEPSHISDLHDVLPGTGGGLIEPLKRILGTEPKPAPWMPSAMTQSLNNAVPRIIEKLEGRTPAERAHLVWSSIHHAGQAKLTAPTWVRSVQLAIAAVQPAALPKPAEQLIVYTNFGDCAGLCRVFADGGSTQLQLAVGKARKVEVMLTPNTGEVIPLSPLEVEDTPVTSAASLPVIPEGEELVIPPGPVETLQPIPITPEGAPTASDETTVEASPTVVEAQPIAKAVPQIAPIELEPLPFRIIDLVDMENASTLWQPPANIDTAALTSWQPPLSDGGSRIEPRFYFLVMAGDLEEYTWVELDTYTRLTKLSGLLLPAERYYGLPPDEGGYPWSYVNLDYIDRGAWVDLTVEDVADVMELIKRGKEHVFIIVRPSNLHFFIAAHLWAEMNNNMRDMVLFRQMTAGMEYSPVAELTEWKLPDGVELARFADGNCVSLVLYSQSYLPQQVHIPEGACHMSRAFIDAGGYLKLVPLTDDEVTVDRTPAILYYEYSTP